MIRRHRLVLVMSIIALSLGILIHAHLASLGIARDQPDAPAIASPAATDPAIISHSYRSGPPASDDELAAAPTHQAERIRIVVPAVERISTPEPGRPEDPVVERAWLEEHPDFKYPLIRQRELWSSASPTSDRRRLHNSAMVADHVLVSLRREATIDDLRRQIAGSDLRLRRYLPLSHNALIAFDDRAPYAIEEVLTRVGGFAAVAGVEPDHIVTVAAEPDDPRFGECYGLHNTGQTGGTADQDIDAPEAWELATGSREVVVAVIDSGIDYEHEDLAANIWTNPGEIPDNGIDDDGNGFIDDVHGWDFFNDDADPMDDATHGSHCAGILGAVGDNGIGIAGVNWQVSLMALKFLGAHNSGAASDATEALAYCTMMGADLSSHSWSSGVFLQSFKDELDAAEAANSACVAAAGNGSKQVGNGDTFPATYTNDNVIAVMSLDHDGEKADTSNWGTTAIDIAAHGVDILSCVPDNGYQTKSGTSMATPQVAGAVALLRSVSGRRMPQEEIKEILLASVDRGTGAEGRCLSDGRLNLHAALHKLGIGIGPVVIDDDADGASDGNGDGLVNPGETIECTVPVHNYGDALSGLVGTLTSASAAVSITRSEITYGDLATTASADGTFVCRIAPAAATPQVVELTLTLRSAGGTQWERTLELELVTSTSIAGTVRRDGESVGGVQIFYAGDRGGSLTTAADGSYQLHLPAGDYALRAQRPGWVPTDTVQITTPTAESVDFDFTTAVVAGRVFDDRTLDAIADAQVSYSGRDIASAVTSDATGSYRAEIVFGRTTRMTVLADHPDYFTSEPVIFDLPPDRSQDFALGRPIIRVEPTAWSITTAPATSVTRTASIHNDGTRDLKVFFTDEAAGPRIVDETSAGEAVDEIAFIPPPAEAARTLMGVTFDGTHLYLSLWDVNKTWHAHVYQIDRASGMTVAVQSYNRYTDKQRGIESLAWGEEVLWVLPESPGNEIWQCDPTTAERLLTITVPDAENPYSAYLPRAVAWGDGSVWALDSGLSRYDPTTGDHLETLALPEDLPGAESITWLDGAIYVLGMTRGRYPAEYYEIWRVDPETGDGSRQFIFENRDGSDRFEDLASDGDSKLFVTDRIRDVVVTFDSGLHGWLQSDTSLATIAPGGTFELSASCDATLAGPGLHHGAIALSSNDPPTPLVTLPVTFLVTNHHRRISMDDLPPFLWDCSPAGVSSQHDGTTLFDQLQPATDHELTATPAGNL